MKKFQEMCQEEFEKIELMARGGQKIVFDGVHNSYGETVIKLYFQLNDPRSLREIQIERDLNLSMVPKIYETGTIEYEGTETLYIIEQKVKGTELRKVLESGKRFSLEEAVTFLEQGLEFIACIENKGIVHRDIKPENIIRAQPPPDCVWNTLSWWMAIPYRRLPIGRKLLMLWVASQYSVGKFV